MDSIGSRIGNSIKESGLSQKDFADKIGVTEQAIGNYIHDRRFPKAEILLRMKQAFGVSVDWLLTGSDEKTENQIKIANNIVAEPTLSFRKTKDAIYDFQRIPVFNLDASMGLVPKLNDNEVDQDKIIDYIQLGAFPECDGATTATGDSMYPLLKAGDLVAYKNIPVDRDYIFFGEIYLLAILIDESTTMKTIKFVQQSDRGDNYIKIVSHNQHHSPKDVKLSKVSAMGLVRASIRIHN